MIVGKEYVEVSYTRCIDCAKYKDDVCIGLQRGGCSYGKMFTHKPESKKQKKGKSRGAGYRFAAATILSCGGDLRKAERVFGQVSKPEFSNGVNDAVRAWKHAISKLQLESPEPPKPAYSRAYQFGYEEAERQHYLGTESFLVRSRYRRMKSREAAKGFADGWKLFRGEDLTT